MSFLNSGFLWLLPLVGLPLLIHLLGRRRYQVVEFSTLRFLKSLQTDVLRRLKIRQIILLIIRTLLILGLILIFARPYHSGTTPGIFVAKGSNLYLIVDNSASMSLSRLGQTRFESALEIINSGIRNIDFPVNLNLISTTQSPAIIRHSRVNSPGDLPRELSKLTTTNFGGKILLALQVAVDDIIKNNDPNGIIWLVSDFQRSNLSEEPLSHKLLEEIRTHKIRLVLFPVSGETDNAAIGGLNFVEEIHAKDKPVTLHANLLNWQTRSAEIPVSLFIEEERVGQALLKIASTKNTPVNFEFMPFNTGVLSGYLETDEDDFPLDNRRFFVLDIPDRLKILIVGKQATDGSFILKALQASPDQTVSARFITSEYLANENLSAYDGLIFTNVSSLSAASQNALDNYLDNGGGLLLFACHDGALENFNTLWANRFGFPRWHDTRRATDDAFLGVGNFDPVHPIFRGLWSNNIAPANLARFFQIPGLICGPSQKVLMTFDDGTPLLVETQRDAGRTIMLATVPEGDWTDLPFSGIFPVLMQRVVLYISGSAAQPIGYATGDSLVIARIPGENALPQIQTPSGRRFTPHAIDERYTFEATDETGIYTVYRDGNRAERFAVNLPESETVGEFFTENDFRTLIKANPANVAVVNEISNGALNQLTLTHEYTTLLLLLVLFLAAAETYLGRLNRAETGKAPIA